MNAIFAAIVIIAILMTTLVALYAIYTWREAKMQALEIEKHMLKRLEMDMEEKNDKGKEPEPWS